jgi:hypothetical protein
MNAKTCTTKRNVAPYLAKYLRRCDSKAAWDAATNELAALVADGRLQVTAKLRRRAA